jgi:hypothetical protein
MKKLITLLLASTLAAPALAHDDATLDKMKTPHGGQMRMAGAYHFELLLNPAATPDKDSPVTVYLSNHGDGKIPSAGASGTAILLSSKGKTTIPLTAAGDNKLTGNGKYQSEPGLKAVVTITFADKTSEQARFTPLQNTAGATAHMHH